MAHNHHVRHRVGRPPGSGWLEKAILARMPPDEWTVAQAAEHLGTSREAVSHTAGRMAKQGSLVRKRWGVYTTKTMTTDLITRRAEFVYESARLAALAANAPVIPAPWSEREDAFRSQFLEVIERQCGPLHSNSPEELHGSWVQAYIDMGWTYGEVYDTAAKKHPDLVPYAQLEQREQDKDSVFVALCEIAREWIRE